MSVEYLNDEITLIFGRCIEKPLFDVYSKHELHNKCVFGIHAVSLIIDEVRVAVMDDYMLVR